MGALDMSEPEQAHTDLEHARESRRQQRKQAHIFITQKRNNNIAKDCLWRLHDELTRVAAAKKAHSEQVREQKKQRKEAYVLVMQRRNDNIAKECLRRLRSKFVHLAAARKAEEFGDRDQGSYSVVKGKDESPYIYSVREEYVPVQDVSDDDAESLSSTRNCRMGLDLWRAQTLESNWAYLRFPREET